MTRTGTWRAWSGYLFAGPYLLLFGGFIVLPLIYGLVLSGYQWELLSAAPPAFVGLANYKEAIHSQYVWMALWATLKFAAFAVPATVGLALLAACGMQAIPVRRQHLYRAAWFMPGILTVSVAALLWRWFFNDSFGLFNGLLSHVGVHVPWLTNVTWAMVSLVIMTVWWTVGGPMVILVAGLLQVPRQYLEAAELDGAIGFNLFRFITLPLLKPILQFVLVLNTIGAFQVFGQTFMLTSGGPEFATRCMVQYIYETAFKAYRMGYASALSWIMFAIIVVFSLAQLRLMRER